MRIVLLLLVSFAAHSLARAQDSFVSKITLDDATKAEYLFKVIPLDNYCIFLEESEDTIGSFLEIHEGYAQNFQFYKTSNNDTLFIFNGELCGGHEVGVVNVCQFFNGQPKTLVSRSGKIAGIQGDEVWIYSYPCCAQVINIIVPFSLRTGEKQGNAHVFYSRFDYANIFPIREKPNQTYQLAKESEIRWSPFEKDNSQAPVCESFENSIGNMPVGTSFTLIKISSNDWALIRLEGMSTSEGYCIDEYRQKLIAGNEYTLYGWVPIGNIKWE